ncbi:MAG TPA: hypothetical protein VH092_00400 [Urbifossiella sp.]|jgi:hypothetical protein|nr:hypothetical protein [Urbifossiella sp.]
MTAVPKVKLTEAEYLAIEEKAAFKSEFYRGEMFATPGALTGLSEPPAPGRRTRFRPATGRRPGP